MKYALKATIAAIISISAWVIGDLISRGMNNKVLWRLYPIYNGLMGWSVDIEDWAEVSIMWEAKK